MTTNIEEKIELEIWEVLQQLKRDILLTAQNRRTIYEVIEYHNNNGYPDLDSQRKIIYKLDDLRIINIAKKHYVNPRGSIVDSANMTFELRGDKPKGFLLDIFKDKFDEIFNEYEKKYSNNKKISGEDFYITKNNDDFYYKGKLLEISKDNDYYNIFCSIYALIPKGGEISYEEIAEEIKSRIKKTKNYSTEQIRKLILTNTTDKSNGFMYYANIPNTEDNGKPLLSSIRDKGIYFNNKKG